MRKRRIIPILVLLLCISSVFGQYTDTTLYDFRDGVIIGAGESADGTLKLSGTYSHHGTTYGLNMKPGTQIKIAVDGACTVRFLGSQHSSLSMSGATAGGDTLNPSELPTVVVNDLSDSYEFVYSGFADTLVYTATGTGSDIYLPQVEVFVSGINYDFRDGVIIAAGQSADGSLALNGSYSQHGTTYGLNMKADAQIKVAVSGSCIIKFLGSQHSSLSMSGTTKDGRELDPAEVATLVVNDLSDTYEFAYTGFADTLLFTATGTGSDVYLPLMQVILSEPPVTYDFRDGVIIGAGESADGALTLSGSYSLHGAIYGLNMKLDASINIIVSGSGTIRFLGSEYSSLTMSATSKGGTSLNPSEVLTTVVNDAVDYYEFTYDGDADTLVFTATGEGSDIYLPLIEFIPGEIEEVEYVSDGKIDVWDFGAEELDTAIYDNQLTEEIINAWYDESITVGSSGNVLPSSFTAGDLSWVGGTNDRLRTSNSNLTRYDENLGGASGYTARVYVNGSAATSRYMSLNLREDDEVTLVMLSQNGGSDIHFTYAAEPSLQDDIIVLENAAVELSFVAKYAGEYRVYDSKDKPSYFRIYKKDADNVTITGSIDVSAAAGIPSDYSVIYENEVGKTWLADMSGNSYSLKVPAGYTYEVSLGNANGYIINSGSSIDVTTETSTFDLTVEKVELFTVSGTITGLDTYINTLELVYVADPAANKIFIPEPIIDAGAGTYTVQLEPSCEYTIQALDVNDYSVETSAITIGQADETSNIVFIAKPLYSVSITAPDLSSEQLDQLGLTFSNLNEEGYVYAFVAISDINLRDGVYTTDYKGLDLYPVQLGATSNLTVDGANTSKELVFAPISIWGFDDKPIANGDTAYNGLLFTGSISSQLAKAHLVGNTDGTIKVPAKVGQKVKVSFYYSADFYFEGGDTASTTSGSTSVIEYAEHTYSGVEDGYVTIVFGAGTSYFTEISVVDVIAYSPTITVGVDKDFQTINEALLAIEKMSRPENERVTVLIDAGNYEEMLVVNVPNVTLKNASLTPDIKLANASVDISDNAVRITSYYGHGYDYYSMDNQKWSADALRVNTENGYLSYENTGSGSTNGSYWNATVVIYAAGFEADHIIFENSFNQYISQKESEDVVVEWISGGKGTRPTDIGNTAVQARSFVERAAAIAFAGSADKAVLNRCRVVGRQDSFYGTKEARMVIYKGAMMGAVDYIFGGMVAVFYKSDLVMNVSDNRSDKSYLTAAQHDGGRGYLMYECTVTSATPGTETASEYRANPGYFGRPWQANTSEVVFYNTNIETSNNPGYDGVSLIMPEGWTGSLGGESEFMYEYGTIEESGVDNEMSRAIWATYLDSPALNDGTEITTFNFTKGTDSWDPLPELIENDTIVDDEDIDFVQPISTLNIKVYGAGNRIYLKNVESHTRVNVYSINGTLVKSLNIQTETSFEMREGLWLVKVVSGEAFNTMKVVTY